MVIDPGNSSLGKAHGKGTYGTSQASTRALSDAPTANKPATPAPLVGDSVSLSAQAQKLVRLETRIQQAPDVDKQKVESLKQAIAEGRYKIDPHRIAEAMLSDELGAKP